MQLDSSVKNSSLDARAADQRGILAEFLAAGVRVKDVGDLVNTSAPYRELYPILVRHLDLPHDRSIRECIIRSLTMKDARDIAEAALMRHFQSESDPHLRWVLASALKTVMPYHKRKKFPEIAHAFANYRRI
jgi:hypothetical protein